MPEMPPFYFFLSDRNHPVIRGAPLWHSRMPVQRHQPPPADAEKPSFTYGEYFDAVSLFVSSKIELIADIVGDILKKRIMRGDLDGIAVYLEKHGAFYHPSRVAVSFAGKELNFVVNVAISDIGKKTLEQEVVTLNRLKRVLPFNFIPEVYANGSVDIHGERSAKLFLGEWFDGFSEFHGFQKNHAGPIMIKVWDPVRGSHIITGDQAAAVYEKAAEILTAYYNLETCEQIFAWHHAAGDFIVKIDPNDVTVKLVTVRRYGRMFSGSTNGPDAMVNGLVLFLLNMSLRMRIDRMDGVGGLIWLDDYALTGAVRGFFKGLGLKEKTGECPLGLADSFRNYLLQIPRMEIEETWADMLDRFPQQAPELSIIKKHIGAHADAFHHTLNAMV